MKVWQVSEDIHGLIATCSSYESAVWFLICYNWINRHSEYWDNNIEEWVNIFQLVNISTNKNYNITNKDKEKLYHYIIEHFGHNDEIWEDWIYFKEEEIETSVPI